MSSGLFEITHDSLAAKIWEKVSAEEKTLIEVMNFITNSFAIYKSRRVLLTKQDIAYIAPYENKLTLDDETLAFIARSKRFYRNQKITTGAIIAVIMGALMIGILITTNANKKAVAEKAKAEKAQATAETEKANALSEKSNAEKEKARAEGALSIAETEKENAEKEKTKAKNAEKEAIKQKENADKERKKAESATENAVVSEKAAVKAREDVTKAKIETDKTLKNTALVVENPTLALRTAITDYATVTSTDLKDQLKKNAYDAFDEIIYTTELKLTNPLQDIAISYDGQYVLMADSTRVPKVWKIGDAAAKPLYGHLNPVTLVAASPGGANYITVENHKLNNATGGKRENKWEAIFWDENFQFVDTASFSDDLKSIKYINGNNLLLGFKNGKMAIADKRGKIKQVIQDDQVIGLEEVIVSRQSPSTFITRSSDDVIRLWNKDGNTDRFKNQVIFNDSRLTGYIIAMALSPNEDQLALACDKGIFRAQISNAKFSNFEFEIYFSGITRLAFRNNDELVASTSNGHSFVYDLLKKEYKKVNGHAANARITHLLVNQNNNRFITVGSEGSLKVWNDVARKMLLFRSEGANKNHIVNNNFDLDIQEGKFKLTNNAGINVSFDEKKAKSHRNLYHKTDDDYYWDTAHYYLKDVIEIRSTDFYDRDNPNQSLSILENSTSLATIRLADLFQSDKKLKNKKAIVSAIISDCRKYVLLNIEERSGKNRYYYIYPTFEGLIDLVNNKKLFGR